MIQKADTGHPAGTIVVPTGAMPRFWEFSDSLEYLIVPEGTRRVKAMGCDIARNLNIGVRRAIGEWVWFLGDDHLFAPDTLLRLLTHQVDVVVPVTPSKMAPWNPCVFHGPWSPGMRQYTRDELSAPGLLKLPDGDLIGQAGMLVRKPVLDEIGDPWFKVGRFDPGQLHEDIGFCKELQERGHAVWVDCDLIFEHLMHFGIRYVKHEGTYVPALRSGSTTVILPPYTAPADVPVPDSRVQWVRQ